MGEDARDFIINLTPLMLRVSLEVVFMDTNRNGQMEMQRQLYAAETPDFFLEVDDSLNLHSTVLSVILKGGHYDIIYRNHWNEMLDPCIKREKEIHEILTEHLTTHTPRSVELKNATETTVEQAEESKETGFSKDQRVEPISSNAGIISNQAER